MYSSTTNGSSWARISAGLEPPANSSINSGFSIAASETNLFAGNVNGIYLLTPNSTSWTRVVNGLENWRITQINASANSSTVFASGYQYDFVKMQHTYAAFVSTNNGDNWRQIITSNNIIGPVIKNGGNTFVGTYGSGIYLSDNNGNNWTEINNGLTGLKVTTLLANGNTIFAGAYNSGLFYSTNNGNSWRAANEGLPTRIIYKMYVSGNYLLIGTDMGVFRRPLNEFISVGTKDKTGDLSCTLSPNPVSDVLTINCSNELINKKYTIQNVLGKSIKADVLTDNVTTLNVSDLANGIYFLNIVGTSKTIKFVKE